VSKLRNNFAKPLFDLNPMGNDIAYHTFVAQHNPT
jgi:hypothetical protein